MLKYISLISNWNVKICMGNLDYISAYLNRPNNILHSQNLLSLNNKLASLHPVFGESKPFNMNRTLKAVNKSVQSRHEQQSEDTTQILAVIAGVVISLTVWFIAENSPDPLEVLLPFALVWLTAVLYYAIFNF